MQQNAINTLTNLKPGLTAIIDNIQENEIKNRLLEMGFAPNKKVKMVSVAPLGDPLLVEINGYKLMLRKYEASLIILKPFTNE